MRIFFIFLLNFILIIFLNLDIKAVNNTHILATVNGINIYNYDIDTRIKILKLLDSNFKHPLKDYKKLLITQIIDEYIIIEDTKNYNFTVSEIDVEKQIHYIESLNKWDKNEIYKKIDKYNLTKNDINNYFYNQYLIQTFIQSIGYSRAQISQNEFNKEYYNLLNLNGKMQYLVSEIFISTTNNPLTTAKQQINNIYNNLKKGTNFNLLVSSYSENIYSKNNNGLIGWIYETQLSDEGKKALNTIKKNEFTKPIQMDNGFYIFKLLDKTPIIYIDPNDIESTSKLKDMLREKLLSEKAQELINIYVNNLKNRAIIKYYYNDS